MNRIVAVLNEQRSRGRGAVVPFICGSHPSPGSAAGLLPALAGAGAAVIEVGIPFSDPIADGPVIAAAMHEALLLGATPASVLQEIGSARARTGAGIVAMVSVSLVERQGAGAFVRDCAQAGIDGLIIPDLPLEESDGLRGLAKDAGLVMPLLIAPTSPPARAARIAAACTGFVYLLARAGITGERRDLDAGELAARVGRLRGATDLPIACGFGISTPAQVRLVLENADAAIVGSALVRRLGEAGARGADVAGAGAAFVAELCAGAAASR